MPSSSRYLATVRREREQPWADMSSQSFWSDRGFFLVLPGDKLLQQRLGRVGGGGLVACGGAQAAGEKVAQGIHAHGALDILLLYRPAHCGLVDADALGHVGQGQGNQVAGPLAEKGLLEFQNTLGARMRVERRCSMALTIHLAWRTLPVR